MVIVDKNLEQLIKQHNIVDANDAFDVSSIKLRLHKTIKRVEPTKEITQLDFGQHIPESLIKKEDISENGLILLPKTSVLACSQETVRIPAGYMGFVQTKGSLARHFVSAHFSDGQIDAGYVGKITFEIYNASDFKIRILEGQQIANMYIFKTSTKAAEMYNGRYNNAKEPTHPLPVVRR